MQRRFVFAFAFCLSGCHSDPERSRRGANLLSPVFCLPHPENGRKQVPHLRLCPSEELRQVALFWPASQIVQPPSNTPAVQDG